MCISVAGPMWRLSTPAGVRPIGRGEEDPHHVSAEGAVRSWGGETSHRTPDHRGKKQLMKCTLSLDHPVSAITVLELVVSPHVFLSSSSSLHAFAFLLQAPSKKKIEINTIASNYHLEVNPR